MMKKVTQLMPMWAAVMFLGGCGADGQKTASLSVAYCVMALLSLLLLVGCVFVVRRENRWFFLLFASVLVVNCGYFALSVSRTLEQALWANRVAYLGSVFLPAAMLMIMLKVTGMRFPKWLPAALVAVGIPVFLVAASPGFSTIYYREVSVQIIDGICVLQKVYGPWHILYLFYLLGYFAAMVAVVICTARRKELGSPVPAIVLAVAVFANIGVWFIEQLVNVRFEILSVSYILSELFLLGLHVLLRENRTLQQRLSEMNREEKEMPQVQVSETQRRQFREGLASLTRTERAVFDCYVAGMSTKEILAELSIKENTLKFHNKNIYGKLGVSSRKQLVELERTLQKNNP